MMDCKIYAYNSEEDRLLQKFFTFSVLLEEEKTLDLELIWKTIKYQALKNNIKRIISTTNINGDFNDGVFDQWRFLQKSFCPGSN